MIEQTATLQADVALAGLVRDTDQLLKSELQQYSRAATAKWDLQHDERGRPVLLLTLRDPFGFASDHFAPDELHNQQSVNARFHSLVGTLLQSSRRAAVAIQETRLSAEQLEALRLAMNADPVLLGGNPRLQNQLRINTDGSFTVRDFSIEVDQSVVAAAKQAVINAGLTPKGQPLVERPGVVGAVQALVNEHRNDPTNPPRLVLWFRLDDVRDVHLLEVSDEINDSGDGALDGVALGAGSAVPGARSIVLYLASPNEVRKAFEVNSGHPAIEAMVNRNGRVMYPPGNWQAMIDEFPEIVQQPVP